MDELLEIEFPFDFAPTPEQVAVLGLQAGKPVELDDGGRLTWGSRLFMTTAAEACSMNTSFEVKRRTGMCRLDGKPPIAPAPVNERCHVVVAGTSLPHIDKVRLLLDCCTDQLGDALGDGWRILAICVQPDQRRPDYVLGRTTGS